MNARTVLSAARRACHLPLLAAARSAPSREPFDRDVRRFLQPRLDLPLPDELGAGGLLDALAHPEVRSVLYLRLRADGGAWALLGALLRRVWRGQVALHLVCDDIGPGLFVSHGFATIVVAGRIGRDCLISQQVTVGYSDRGGPPTLGDRVRLGAGAIVLGPIHVGDDAVIGAGAVVVGDVPAGKVVGGVPARVIEHAQDRYAARRSTSARSSTGETAPTASSSSE